MATLPRTRPDLSVVDLDDGAVVFDPTAGVLHVLNATAALVLDGCRNAWDADDLSATVSAAAGVDASIVAADVEACVADLRHRGLVADDPGAVALPEPARGVARRAGGHPAHPCAPVRVLDEVVVFRCDETGLATAVDELLADLRAPSDVEAPTPSRTFDLRAIGPCRAVLEAPDDPTFDLHGASLPLSELVSVLNAVASTSSTCLAFHAGLVRSPDGHLVALMGESGAGKSTLVAHLVQHGWAYLSDEVAAVRISDLAAVAYPKPLSLDGASRTLLGLDGIDGHLVPPGRLRPGALDEGPVAVPALLALLERTSASTATVVPVATGDALTAVAPHVLNLRWSGDDGLRALVELSRHTSVGRLRYATVDEGRRALHSTLAVRRPGPAR